MEFVAGVTATVKSGAVTFRVTFALCANSSVPVPVIVRIELPPGVFADVVTIMVEVPDAGWRREMQSLAPRYLATLNRYAGQKVERIEFVIGQGKRE